MPTFERDSVLSLSDLMQTSLQPSRSVGPPDPNSPANTWAAGIPTPEPIPPTQGASPQPVVAYSSPSALLGSDTSGVRQEEVPDILLFETGFVKFGGEAFLLSEPELGSIVEIVLEAYERVLRDRATSLRGKYMLKKEGREDPVQEQGPPGP